jgi:signal transduction histidine kinase
LGISSDDLERTFEPFYTKKVMGRSGTCLGLAVVWNVVQDHRGYINGNLGELRELRDVLEFIELTYFTANHLRYSRGRNTNMPCNL